MGKSMTNSERAVYKWLVEKYGPGVKYNYNRSPDFILPDGKMFEAKYVPSNSNVLFFTKKQWDSLADNVEIVVVDNGLELLCTVKMAELRKLRSEGKLLKCGDRKLIVRVDVGTTNLVIKCSEETAWRFRRFVTEYRFRDYEDALVTLLNIVEDNKHLLQRGRGKFVEVY
jgi:hypothetical protein